MPAGPRQDTAERRFARGDGAFVGDLATALTGRFGSSSAHIWQYRSVSTAFSAC
ncbi:DUF6183 family protein [Streptomyces griseosporeus]|uniref:DUF6183 family protein n=1 Tax=Streptomyces griseosporeus TaxID=1910 RepID=UPI0036FEF4BB